MPEKTKNVAKTAGNPLASVYTALDCSLNNMISHDLPLVYARLVWANILPAIYMVAVFIGIIIIACK